MKALATIGRTVTIYKDRFIYPLGACITILDNGEWLAGFNHSRRREGILHPPTDPLYRNLLIRSSDQGATWTEPYFVPGFDWSGLEHPCLTQLKNGTVILTHFRFAWYPLGIAKKKRSAGEPIAIMLPDRKWTEDFTDDDWDRSQLSWARGDHGLYAHFSTDRGYTFENTVKINCSPYRDGYTRTGVTELHDGRIALMVSEHHTSSQYRITYILFSNTGGNSWDPPIPVVDIPGLSFNEPHIAEVSPGEIYGILRTSKEGGYLHGCRSFDGGHTWSSPEITPMYTAKKLNPGHLLILKDGRLLCTYGRRTAPFGIRACLSDDDGRSWNINREIIIRDDLPNWNLGYPTTIEYAPGKLFCIYWGQEPDGVTSIQGTYITLEAVLKLGFRNERQSKFRGEATIMEGKREE